MELDAEAYTWQVALAQGWLSPSEVRKRAVWFAELLSGWLFDRTGRRTQLAAFSSPYTGFR